MAKSRDLPVIAQVEKNGSSDARTAGIARGYKQVADAD
jgi:hypothetical protein